MVRAEEGQAWPQVNERVRLHEGSGGSSTKATIHHCTERPDINYTGGVKRTWHVIRDDGIYHEARVVASRATWRAMPAA